MTLPTQNPIPSSLKNDQLFNAEKIDQVVNSDDLQYTDRFGKKRFTFSGLYNVIQNWIASLSSSSGASSVGLSQGGTVQNALSNYINVEQFSSYNTSNDDWGPAFRAAVAYAKANGIAWVEFRGNYTITSVDTVTWTTPFDDGTVSPERIAAGQDTTISPETQYTMPVHINLPYGVGIRSNGIMNNSLSFGWVRDTGEVSLSSAIGICCRVKNWDGTYAPTTGAINRTSAVTSSNFDGFTVSNAFIGILSDGVTQWNQWNSMRFSQCGFAVLQQGSDISFYGTLIFNGCYVGMCIGGWWLQRNAGAYPSSMLPPYPAKDTFVSGWIDAVQIKELQYDFPIRDWNERTASFDTFFNTYFYKTANNASRLTSKLNDLTTNALTSFNADPFRGVATRAFAAISRYQHTTKTIRIGYLKTLCTYRPPVLTSQTVGSGNTIDKAYVERCGWLDPANKTTDFFASGVDSWNTGITSLPAVCVQGLMGVALCTPVHTTQVKISSGGAVRFSDVIESQRFITGQTGSVRLARLATWDDNSGFKSCFEVQSQYTYMPGITSEASGLTPTGSYPYRVRQRSTAAFTAPFLTNGVADSTQAVAFRTARISMIQTGKTVKAYYFLWFDSYTTLTGTMYISMSSLPLFRVSSGSPLPDPSADFIGPSGCKFDLIKCSSGVGVIPVAAGFVYSSDTERYLVLYSDQKRTTALKPSDFTQGSVMEFCIEYPANADWS